MTTANTRAATITENGNGLPSIGALCCDASSDSVYRVAKYDPDLISTHGPGCGNSIDVLLEYVGRASDLTDEEWDAIESDNYGVTIRD